MNDGFRVLALVGGLERASSEYDLLMRAMSEFAPGGVAVEPFARLRKIPYFDPGSGKREVVGDPDPVRDLKERIRRADAVIVVTPEHEYDVPWALTNALAWTLRSPSPVRRKPVGIVWVGRRANMPGWALLYRALLRAPAYVMPDPEVRVPGFFGEFDASTGALTDGATRRRLRRFLEELVQWSRLFERPRIPVGGAR